MGVATEAGYTWVNGKYARLMHAGNVLTVKEVTAADDTGATADLVLNDLTVDRWVPFDNALEEAQDLSETVWTLTGATVGEGGARLSEDASTGEHLIEQEVTFTAREWVVAVQVQRETASELRLVADDGTTAHSVFFDLHDKTVGTESNATGGMREMCDGTLMLRMYFTPAAATGSVAVQFANGSETVSYTGSTDNTVTARNVWASPSASTLRLAAIGSVAPTDDAPIMFFFDEVTSDRWRVSIDRGADPRIAVLKVGDPLTFPQGFYAGFTPSPMQRSTEVLGNLSGTGELLGRSRRRTVLSERAEWAHLKYSWVRDNLDGRGGVIRALETGAAFMAWRPELVPDVSYFMRAAASPPAAMGIKDFWSFGIEGEVHAHE